MKSGRSVNAFPTPTPSLSSSYDDLFVLRFFVHRLKVDLQNAELTYKESLDKTHIKYTNEVMNLKEQIQESEAARESLQKEVILLKEKVDHLRIENITEAEETTIELKRIHDREQVVLVEENKRLLSDVEEVRG